LPYTFLYQPEGQLPDVPVAADPFVFFGCVVDAARRWLTPVPVRLVIVQHASHFPVTAYRRR
jgi:hypothetical protein